MPEKTAATSISLGDIYLALFDGRFATFWFRWVEWMTISAAVYAAGVLILSPILIGISYISQFLVGVYVIGAAETLVMRLDRRIDTGLRSPLLRHLARMLAFFAYLAFAAALIGAINDALLGFIRP